MSSGRPFFEIQGRAASPWPSPLPLKTAMARLFLADLFKIETLFVTKRG